MPACPNCSAELTGEYCASCGQQRLAEDDLSMRRMLRVSSSEIADYLLQFKTFRTFRALLVHPGKLTQAFLAGRRQPYLLPTRVYLVSAATFFVLAPFVGLDVRSMVARDPGSPLVAEIARAMAASPSPDRFAAQFDRGLRWTYTLSLGLAIWVAALLAALLFRSQRRSFGAHMVFAAHYVSYSYFLTAGVAFAIGFFDAAPRAALLLSAGLAAPYVCVAMRRVYGEPWPRTTLKGLAFLAGMILCLYPIVRLASRLTLALVA